jgi:hypothetical protein
LALVGRLEEADSGDSVPLTADELDLVRSALLDDVPTVLRRC